MNKSTSETFNESVSLDERFLALGPEAEIDRLLMTMSSVPASAA